MLFKVRKEIKMENLAKCYQREILKKECWDSMQVKGKAIKVSSLKRKSILCRGKNCNNIHIHRFHLAYLELEILYSCQVSVSLCTFCCPQAFHSENEVKNYPMKERTEKELEELQRIETMRQIEQENSQVCVQCVTKTILSQLLEQIPP